MLAVVVLALAGNPLAALAQSNANLPDLGTPAGTLANLDDEAQIGQMIVREARQQNLLIDDPESAEYLESLGLKLSSQAPDSDRQFHYLLFNESDINAEATLGAVIFCDYGTILAADSESELAGVLAHETAHITQRHMVRGALKAEHASLATAAALLGAVLLGAMGAGPEAIEGGVLAAEGMGAQMQINFTRDQEEEADRVGITYLARAGFDPMGLPDFFQKMVQLYGYSETQTPRMLVNHPVFPDRIADARARAAQLEQQERPRNFTDSVSFGLIKERLRVLTAADDFDLRTYYDKRMQAPDPPLSIRYGQALALYQRGHPAEAVTLLKPLVAQHQGVILLYSLLGQAQVAAGQAKDGLATFARAETLFPRNVPLTVRYAEALIKTGDPRQAHALLLDLFNNEEPTPGQIRLTALAASAAGDAGDAYYYMGEYNISLGDLRMATQQLELALASPHLTFVQRKRFQARLEEIRTVLADDRRENGKNPQNSGGY
ncbi:MAG TPA: M48 family metalloprotease [Steroidobacteraceae bacterium]|nr:M48 family metalloprotease [Steroidobacteraceae bacterium]